MDSGDAYLTRNDGLEHWTTVRGRKPDDLSNCVALLADVHAANGYPMHWPADPPTWLTPHALLAAWVAEDDSGVIGHVALCRAPGRDSRAHLVGRCRTPTRAHRGGRQALRCARARGRGLGAALLAFTCGEARVRDLRPALEVLDHDRSAIALYERAGWRRVASAEASWAPAGDGRGVLYYYIAPK